MLRLIRRELGNVKRRLQRSVKASSRKLETEIDTQNFRKLKTEIDTLYALLYELIHDLDKSVDLTSRQTKDAFAHQWEKLKEGNYLLSDPWFRKSVDRILWKEEIQIKPEWFKGKDVLDAGCGNGRWSFGLAKLGANITAVDINQVAIDETRNAISDFDVDKDFYISPLEDLSINIPPKKYDLVFSWGVVHHCSSFNGALNELIKFVKDDGILYIYLYGRESIPYLDDLEIFKERIKYNTLRNEEDRYQFLLKKAEGNPNLIHNYHDAYAPLINRRLDYDYVHDFIKQRGFEDIVRTIDNTEIFIRAIKGNAKEYYGKWLLPKKKPPYWFHHHNS